MAIGYWLYCENKWEFFTVNLIHNLCLKMKRKKIMLLIKGKKLIISNINSKNLIIFKNSNEKYINSISIFESEKKAIQIKYMQF